jgi:hypothetical protein
MGDTTNNLFEHIKNRLPQDYEDLGDNNIIIDDEGTPNHKVWEQSLREDFMGDVGVFQTRLSQQEIYHGVAYQMANVQIAVVCINGDIDTAEQYLRQAYANLKSNDRSSSIYVKRCDLIDIVPLGKNSIGNQMIEMDVSLKYVPITNN